MGWFRPNSIGVEIPAGGGAGREPRQVTCRVFDYLGHAVFGRPSASPTLLMVDRQVLWTTGRAGKVGYDEIY